MRYVGILVGVLLILIIGGGLTVVFGDGGVESVMPFLRQSSSPAASALEVEPWQAEQLALLVGFILFNMVGMGATIAVIMWFLHRQVVIARSDSPEAETEVVEAAES